MKRRGFLGFMGGAVAAGPSMAKAAVTSGMETMSLGGSTAGTFVGMGSASALQNSSFSTTLGEYDPLKHAMSDLTKFLGKTADQIMQEKKQVGFSMMDPDLVVNRSFSLETKMRIMRDRVWERNQEAERGWLERRIRDLTSQ